MRYIEDYSGGTNAWSHTHHHHHHKKSKKLKDDNESHDDMQLQSSDGKDNTALDNSSIEKVQDDVPRNSLKEDTQRESYIRKVIYLGQKDMMILIVTCSYNKKCFVLTSKCSALWDMQT